MASKQFLDTIIAYSILFVFGAFALILVGIIIHLIYIAKRNRSSRRAKTTNKKNNKQMLNMIWVTLIGIVSFEISLLLIISVVVEIITIKWYDHDQNLDKYYFSSFETIHIFITIFDDFGHLAMLTVLVMRLRKIFQNSLFGYSKKLLRVIYCCLIILASFALGILIQIAFFHSHSDDGYDDIVHIMITELTWEILIELMDLWLLYLLISKLSQLIVMSLKEDELKGIIKHIISSKRNKSDTNDTNDKPESPSVEQAPDIHRNSRVFSISSDTRQSQDVPDPTAANPKSAKKNVICHIDDKQIIHLVGIMTKMTVLVMIAVFVSMTSLIGNTLFERSELELLKEHTPGIEQIWLFTLPVMDMVITSICLLYLPFNFTNNIYYVLCGKLDGLCLRIIGCILKCKIRHSDNEDAPPIERFDTEQGGEDDMTMTMTVTMTIDQHPKVPKA